MIQSSCLPPLPPEPARAVQRILATGETVLWAAQPSRGRLLQRNGLTLALGLFFILISLAFLGTNRAAGLPVLLIGLPFLAIGVWMTIKPWQNASRAAQTVYVITNQRAMTLRPDGSAQNLTPAEVQERTVKRRANGSGDIYFSAWNKTVSSSDGDSIQRNGFLGIADVQTVAELLGQLSEKNSPSPGRRGAG